MITWWISSNTHPPHKPTENNSHMMMGDDGMVVVDDVDDDGGGDDVEIPLPGVGSRTNMAPETKIVMLAALCFAKRSVLLNT